MSKILIYLEPAEEGGYIASAPALSGCVTQGETREEALEMIRDAIRGYIASMQKHGESLPIGLKEAEFVEIEMETAL
ncbi:MAG: type II toxin-antitoxin system HicB family antitoxin [Fimbriimonadia bacterium]|nr:type II toxin-antitoxin system HicB family antitoxin [Fimbriimonadia bacterium]